ncbi:O-antigen ligase family protein [Alteribacillus sp. HJP-4]|uniref:O-antigen ligase family protein n=1 Tax=Alteribacillus sp. HJP-4 TaxID=2775394 RepID=UPI0035CD1FBF
MGNFVTSSQNNSRIIFLLLLLIVLARFGVDLGFSLKPYMIFLLLFLLVHLSTFYFEKLQLFEIAMIMFFLVYCYSGAFALYPAASLRIFFGIGLYLFCYFITKSILHAAPSEVIDKAVANVGIIFNIISLLMYGAGLAVLQGVNSDERISSFGVMLDRDFPRLIGLLQDPNFFVFYNTIFFAYFLCHFRSLKGKAGLILCITTILLTFSRGGMLAMILMLAVYLLLNNPLRQLKIMISLVSLGGLVLYVSAAHMNFDLPGMLADRIGNVSSDGGSGRMELWVRAWEFFAPNFLFGIGAFNFSEYNTHAYGAGISVHNTFLDVLSESGLIGIFFYLLFIALVFVQLLQGRVHRTKPYLFLTFIGFLLQMGSLTIIINDMFFMFIAIAAHYLHHEAAVKKVENKTHSIPKKIGVPAGG